MAVQSDSLRKARAIGRRAKRNPPYYFRATPPQRAWLKDSSIIKLMLGGNQVGKTMGAAFELVTRCLGTHPFLSTDRPPIDCYLITHSHQQSIVIQKKIFEMCPKDELDPSVEFVDGKGFRGEPKIIKFKNGSIIHIKTANQGLALASATISYAAVDEPISNYAWGEVRARVLRGGQGGRMGSIGITMTPVGEDVEWLRKLVNDGVVSCHQAPLTVEATTPYGCRPIITQTQIDEVTKAYLPIDREARIRGDWDVGIPDGITFDAYDPLMMYGHYRPEEYRTVRYAIGIDHGSKPGSQVVLLTAIDLTDPYDPWIWVLDEYIAGTAQPEVHARVILEMLKRNKVNPAEINWTGDNNHKGNNSGEGKMSNSLLMRGFERIMNVERLPFVIRTIKKPRHSVYSGAGMLQMIMSRRRFYVHARCKETNQALSRWVLKADQVARSKDRYGHKVDALRYATVPLIDYNRVQVPYSSIRVL